MNIDTKQANLIDQLVFAGIHQAIIHESEAILMGNKTLVRKHRQLTDDYIEIRRIINLTYGNKEALRKENTMIGTKAGR